MTNIQGSRKIGSASAALLTALFTAGAVTASAQSIALISSATNFNTNGTSNANAVSSFTFSDFSLGAGNALVVVINSEATTATNSFSVTFGGDAVSSNVFINQGAQAAGVYWIINPSVTTGDVVVNLGQLSRAGVSVLSLSNVGAFGDSATFTSTLNTNTNPFTMNYDAVGGGFVVGGYIDNAASVAVAPTISGGNFSANLLSRVANEGGSSSGLVQAYGSISSTAIDVAGTFTSARNHSTNNRHAAALVAFTAVSSVPEPSAFAALAGIAAVGAAALRRRRN